MNYDPRKSKSDYFRNAYGDTRKIIVQRDLLAVERQTIKLLIRASDQPQESAYFDTLKLIWVDRRFAVGEPFIIWGLTMDELPGLARNFSPRTATAYEVHGQFMGFMHTQQMRPARDYVGRRLEARFFTGADA